MSDYVVGDKVIVQRSWGGPSYPLYVEAAVMKETPAYVWVTVEGPTAGPAKERVEKWRCRPFSATVFQQLRASERQRYALDLRQADQRMHERDLMLSREGMVVR